MFETFIVQPIFNLLVFIYATVGDFGAAIIIFTVIVRMLMWPLLRKQLHQSRVMRQLQPQIKALRKKNKGDRPKESAALMELYKKNGVNPMGSFGIMFIQLPVFFGLFSALRALINNPDRIIRLPYGFIRDNDAVQGMIQNIADKTSTAVETLGTTSNQVVNSLPSDITPEVLQGLPKEDIQHLFSEGLVQNIDGAQEVLVQGPFFNQELFGFIDLSGRAFSDTGVYIPVLIIAILAGVFQFFQTRQLMPKEKSKKTLREIMKEGAESGKEPDQSEVSAVVGSKMGIIFAPMIAIISATTPAGLALYFATSGLVGLLQQRTVLKQDLNEMEIIADVTEPKPRAKSSQAKKKKTNKKRNNKKKRK